MQLIILQMHGFYLDMDKKDMRFDVVLSFDVDKSEAIATLHRDIQSAYPDYHVMIVGDIDV